MAAPARPRLRANLLAVAAAAVVIAVGTLLWSPLFADDGAGVDDTVRLGEPGEYVEPGVSTAIGGEIERLPDVALESAAGDPVDLLDSLATDGRPTVVNLWYSTCPPCARELADFADVHAEVGDEVRFVGINPYDTAPTMTRFADDRGVTYELLRDPEFELSDALGVAAFPVTLLVDADGHVVDHTGVVDGAELRALIDEHFG